MTTEILLIDPNTITRAVMKYHLTRAGYVVHEAATSEAALMLDTQSHLSVIVADEAVTLPLGGADRGFAGLPWVVLTDVPKRPTRSLSGMYIAKPVLATQLLRCVEALVAGYSS
jgi:hypothetical protein